MSTIAESPSADTMRQLISGAGDLPVLPELASQILQEIRSPKVTPASLAALIRKDPVLASSVLRVANSTLYGAKVEITDLAFAMTRMGLNQTRNLVLANVLRARLTDRAVYGGQGALLMEHALAVAFASQMLAEALDAEREEAFLCGLLHDFGRLALTKLLREAHKVRTPELPEELVQLVDKHHAEAGALLASEWGLPARVGSAARYHHEVAEAPESDRTMVAIVSLANALAHKLGLGQQEAEDLELGEHPSLAYLSINEAQVAEVSAGLPEVFEAARSSLG